jgi:hypothetical protein
MPLSSADVARAVLPGAAQRPAGVATGLRNKPLVQSVGMSRVAL